MDLGVQVPLLSPELRSFGYILDHMAVLFLAFWGISIMLSIMVVIICILTNSVLGFLFCHIFTSICYCYYPWISGMRWNLMVVLICTSFILFFNFIYLFTCAYIVWVISPPCLPSPPFLLSPPQFQAGPVLPLSLILLKKRHKHNKKGKVFLLVELRIVIQKDSYCCFHVPMCYNPCSFNSDWSLPWFLILCSW
jgi:hypothetical protein